MLRLFRRAEYIHALNLARKARRRGDVVAADRWLKHADRLMIFARRLADLTHREQMQDAELETTRKRRDAATRQQDAWDDHMSLRDRLLRAMHDEEGDA
jgi:hypothetical protein